MLFNLLAGVGRQLQIQIFRQKSENFFAFLIVLMRFHPGFLPFSNLNYAHNERPGRGPAQVMQFGFD
jgi:hypothetical protein